MSYRIFGFDACQNSAFDDVMESLKSDSVIFSRALYSEENIYPAISEINRLLKNKNKKEYAALAAIGLTELCLKKQVYIPDLMFLSFNTSLKIDPLSKYKERSVVVKNLQRQINYVVNQDRGRFL